MQVALGIFGLTCLTGKSAYGDTSVYMVLEELLVLSKDTGGGQQEDKHLLIGNSGSEVLLVDRQMEL